MKIQRTIVLALTALAATALMASAQDNNDAPPGGGPGGHGGPGQHRHPPLPLIKALDVNHDGTIDATEIANASAALKTLDKNSDGQLTADEYLPAKPADAPADAPLPPMPLIVKALDANSDGVIDASEIANASAALAKLDKNGDGKLTRAEFMGPRPHPPQGEQQGGGAPDNGQMEPPPEN
jgi:Ca2+-binding EF-hand superfamily protein